MSFNDKRGFRAVNAVREAESAIDLELSVCLTHEQQFLFDVRNDFVFVRKRLKQA